MAFTRPSVDEWERSLEKLIVSPELRARFGAKGREHVEQRYALQPLPCGLPERC